METPAAIPEERNGWLDRHAKSIKWIITLGCYGYLVYFLYNFEYYSEFAERFSSWSADELLWLLAAVALMPANYGLEAFKWYLLASPLYPALTYRKAFRGTMVGIAAGFFTPNRVGEPLGRVLDFPAGIRLRCATRSIAGSAAQGTATCLLGLAALQLWFSYGGARSSTLAWAGTAAALFVLLLLSLPRLARRFAPRAKGKTLEVISTISDISTTSWLTLLALSCARYTVYSAQLYLMMRFFLVDITPVQGLIAIPLNYLLVSVLPSVAFSEVGVRATCGTICLAPFTNNVLGGALAGSAVWLVNYVLSMLIGTVLTRSRSKRRKSKP